MKFAKTILILIFVVVLSATFFILFSDDIVANAYTGADISIKFTNKSIEISPTATENGYSIGYIPDMAINISGSIASDPEARSDTTIMQDGQRINAIYKAGVYDVTVSVYPSAGGNFVYKTFKFEVLKKEITDIRFVSESVNITYSDELSPELLLDSVVAQNTKATFNYYTDSSLSNEIDLPKNAGEYWVVASLSGDNYFGKAESKLTISKSNASINVFNLYPEITYSKELSGDNGYKIIDLLGATVTNTDNADKHELVTYIKSGEEYIEQANVLIPNTYEYKLFFANGENYTSSPVYGTIILKNADTEILFDNGLSTSYSLDFDALSVIKSFLNKDNGYKLISSETQNSLSEISDNLLTFEFFDSNGDALLLSPSAVGQYFVTITFKGNDFYNESSAQMIPFEITRRNISNEITTFGEQNFDYGEDYSVEDKFVVPEMYDANAIIEYKQVNSDNEILLDLQEKPLISGRYMAVLQIDEPNFYGSKILIFTISKLLIPENSITVDNLEYVYGDSVNIQVTADEKYNISNENISFSYAVSGGDKLDFTPVYAGNYRVSIIIESDIYYAELSKEFSISKKDLIVSAKDRIVTYGNSFFTMDEDNHYKSDDFIVNGLVNELDISSVLASITVFVGEDEYVTNNLNMIVGTYEMKLRGTHSNYNIIDGGCGKLTVEKRVLTVKTSEVKQYVGYTYLPVITVENSVYNDLAENMVYLFEIYYSSNNGEVLNTQPSVSGTYKINARVKSENIDCLELKNYLLNFVGSSLTLLNNQKTDSENLIVLEGKFDVNTTLTVKTVNANESVDNAIKAVDKKYEVSKLYFIQYTFNTVDNSMFTLKLNRKDIDIDNAKIMIGYNVDNFEEVDYTVQGDYIVIRLQNMASYYAICTPHKLPLVWIIVIVIAVVLVLGGVGVFLWIYFTGANVKARKSDATLSGAVTATIGVKTEDEEFDELLENFDESTIVKHEDPAARISRQSQEDEREQYRLYLRRMRSNTDRNASDKLKALGINSDFDEEKAIDQLMEEDRRKRAEREAEAAKIKAEEAKRKQQETGFTINERKSGTLSGVGMPVKPQNNNIDDDIDV